MKISKETAWGGMKKTLWFLISDLGILYGILLVFIIPLLFTDLEIALPSIAGILWIGCILSAFLLNRAAKDPHIEKINRICNLLYIVVILGVPWTLFSLPISDPAGDVLRWLTVLILTPMCLAGVSFLRRILYKRK